MQRILSATTIATTDETQSKWIEVGSKWECYTPEAYLDSSRGKVPTLDQCKQSCVESTGCKSITYFTSKWCSHYSGLCTKTTWNKKVAVSLRRNLDFEIPDKAAAPKVSNGRFS